MHQLRGSYLEAEKCYLKGIEYSPQETFPYIFLGYVASRSGDFQLAEERYRQAIATKGEQVDEAYANLGGVLVALGRYEEAAECYRRALELSPDYHFARLRLEDVTNILNLKAGDGGS